jgi:hypothetical protein
MTDIPIPFVDGDVDTDDPQSALMTVVLLIGGFAVFTMASDIGGYVAQRINSGLAGVLGFNPANGQSEGPDIL